MSQSQVLNWFQLKMQLSRAQIQLILARVCADGSHCTQASLLVINTWSHFSCDVARDLFTAIHPCSHSFPLITESLKKVSLVFFCFLFFKKRCFGSFYISCSSRALRHFIPSVSCVSTVCLYGKFKISKTFCSITLIIRYICSNPWFEITVGSSSRGTSSVF